MRLPLYASMNGHIVPWDEATIHIYTPAVKYGIGVFEGIRGYWCDEEEQILLFRLDEHLDRLAQGERAMRLRHAFSRENLVEQTMALIAANGLRETIHIRLMTYLDGPNEMKAQEPCGIAITAQPRPLPPEVANGVSAQVSSWARIPDRAMPARIKANANYHNSRLAILQAQADGYDVPLLLNMRGDVAESASACIFIVRDGTVLTPPLGDDILESITRDTVITLCREVLGLPVVERSINRSELHAAQEAFLAGSGAEITPINMIDRLPVGTGAPGPIVDRIRATYFDAVHGRLAAYRSWCTPVRSVPVAA